MVNDIERFKSKLARARLPYDLRTKAERYIDRLTATQNMGGVNIAELETFNRYFDWITRIPFGLESSIDLDINQIKKTLDNSHYGLNSVKENVLDFVASQLYAKENYKNPGQAIIPHLENSTVISSPTLCFIGIQGVGKTTMAKAIAKSLGRKFIRISMGGFANVNSLRGIPFTDKVAEPGIIVKSLIEVGTMNPVILLDEIDKISDNNSIKADIMATLLEILDPEQNSTFRDRFIDSPIDLSRVLFIATANNLGGLSSALIDRLELIRFSSYTNEEKIVIAKNYLVPKILRNLNVQSNTIVFNDNLWDLLASGYAADPGIRQLERDIIRIVRKSLRKILSTSEKSVEISADNFREYLPETINLYT